MVTMTSYYKAKFDSCIVFFAWLHAQRLKVPHSTQNTTLFKRYTELWEFSSLKLPPLITGLGEKVVKIHLSGKSAILGDY